MLPLAPPPRCPSSPPRSPVALARNRYHSIEERKRKVRDGGNSRVTYLDGKNLQLTYILDVPPSCLAEGTYRISPTAAETPQTKVDRRISPSRCISLFQQRSFLPSLSPTAASWHLPDLGGHFSLTQICRQTTNMQLSLPLSPSVLCHLLPRSCMLLLTLSPHVSSMGYIAISREGGALPSVGGEPSVVACPVCLPSS